MKSSESEADLLFTGQEELEVELERLKKKMAIGYEVNVNWIPGLVKYYDGKRLKEEVKEDHIFIYVQDEMEAIELVKHGFAEWMLNRFSKPYRQLINSLITLFENQQYEKKEKLIDSLINLMISIS